MTETRAAYAAGYQIIYADPPWRFRNWSMDELAKRGEKWARRNGRSPYPVMNTEDIASMPIRALAARDCTLFLWATYPKLPDALQVMAGWEFEYKTVAFTWVKLYPCWEHTFWKFLLSDGIKSAMERLFVFGLGYWTRQNPEICLLGTRGHPKRISKLVPNLIISPRGEHSQKPAETRDRIVRLMGDLPRVELFARQKVNGWDAWGNEVENDIEIAYEVTV